MVKARVVKLPEGRIWNQKNLDYEIETCQPAENERAHHTWNQKNLDYEIETTER